MNTFALFVWTIRDVAGVVITGGIIVLFTISAVLEWIASPNRWWNKRK